MFDNYTPTINSDNRFKRLEIDKEDEIIIGGTCTHIFILPFKYSTYVVNSKILYKQGLDTVLEKYPVDYILEEDDEKGKTILKLKLSTQDTNLFRETLLDSFVQMRIETVNNETLYNKMSRLKVYKPIADIRVPNIEEEI